MDDQEKIIDYLELVPADSYKILGYHELDDKDILLLFDPSKYLSSMMLSNWGIYPSKIHVMLKFCDAELLGFPEYYNKSINY